MKGITIDDKDDIMIVNIEEYSDEFNQFLRDSLIEICHGKAALTSNFPQHGFEKTMTQLLKLFENKTDNQKKGFIGELLLHLILRIQSDKDVVSPYFNLEEPNFKKGFDVIAIKMDDQSLWLVESKSGEIDTVNRTAHNKIIHNLKAASSDLVSRLNEENDKIWLNAINSVRTALDDKKLTDQKEVVIKLLSKISDTNSSHDKNVIFGGIVFCDFSNKVERAKIYHFLQNQIRANYFSRICIITIQKRTYNRVIKSLRDWSNKL